MSDTPELSNAVTVLIARMETHPEDFAVDDGELYSKSKFGEMVSGLYALSEVDPSVRNAFWYLNDADKQALADAWKKYHYKKFEKKVMERVFDEDYYERQDQARLYEQQMKQQMYQQRMAARTQLLASTGTYQTTTIQPGGVYGLANNTASTGLFGSIGSALGITK